MPRPSKYDQIISAAKKNGARRVEFDGKRVVVVLSEEGDDGDEDFRFDHEQDHDEAA